MDAYLSANQSVLEETYGELLKFLRTLDDAAVNWAPLPADTNSVAAMATHAVGATNSWLSRAAGTPIQRDRDAEFHRQATVADLIKLVEEGQSQARDYFGRLADLDPATIRPVRRLSRGEDQQVSIAWCVEHAVIHAGEHWGQIQLTVQLYRAPTSRPDGSGARPPASSAMARGPGRRNSRRRRRSGGRRCRRRTRRAS